MKRYSKIVFPLFVAFIALLAASKSVALGAVRDSGTILIVPARPAVLKLAFNLENMRAITLVSFRGEAGTTKPLMHVWKGNDWQYVPFKEFCSMAFVKKIPGAAIVIGDDQTVPRALLKNINWPLKIERLQTLNAADLLNGLNPYFDFSSREWRRLADFHGLQLKDLNAAKRSFNPYDIPRSKVPLATHEFKQEKGDAPPAVLIEKSGDRNNEVSEQSALK